VIALARAAAPLPREQPAFSRGGPVEIARVGTAAPVPGGEPPDAPELASRRLRLGVAFDEAFHFYYADTFASLEQEGFELVRFSPLRDGVLPEGLLGLYLGGGYPEVFAAALSDNETMRQSVSEFAASGRLVYAECGGLMYLSESIVTAGGKRHAMCGVLPCGTRMLEQRKALGYAEAELTEDSLWGACGAVARGHEFHYSELAGDPAGKDGWRRAYRIKRIRGGAREMEGFTNGMVLASYVHLHFASRPDMARRLHRRCAKWKRGQIYFSKPELHEQRKA
jgi:cobyrinic acid a,c-diamide synthase